MSLMSNADGDDSGYTGERMTRVKSGMIGMKTCCIFDDTHGNGWEESMVRALVWGVGCGDFSRMGTPDPVN